MSSYIITCPSCGISNRIQTDKEGKTGNCGSCHAAIPQLYSHPQQLTTTSFDSFVANYSGPVLAEFWAPW